MGCWFGGRMAGGWWPQSSTFCGCQKVLWFLLPFLKENKKVWCPKIFLQGGRDELRPNVQALVTAEVRPWIDLLSKKRPQTH